MADCSKAAAGHRKRTIADSGLTLPFPVWLNRIIKNNLIYTYHEEYVDDNSKTLLSLDKYAILTLQNVCKYVINCTVIYKLYDG